MWLSCLFVLSFSFSATGKNLNSFSVSGNALRVGFFPVLIPVGICGNVLSFLVSSSLYQWLHSHIVPFALICFGFLGLFLRIRGFLHQMLDREVSNVYKSCAVTSVGTYQRAPKNPRGIPRSTERARTLVPLPAVTCSCHHSFNNPYKNLASCPFIPRT